MRNAGLIGENKVAKVKNFFLKGNGGMRDFREIAAKKDLERAGRRKGKFR